MFSMFENITVNDIKKDIDRIPKRKNTTEAQAEKAYILLLEKLKKSMQQKEKEKQNKLIRIDYLCK